MRVLVLGGTGFLGRHVVAMLLARGHEVTVGSRWGARAAVSHGMGLPPSACRAVRFERLTAPGAWEPLLHDVDAVVNCVGILRQRRHETFDQIHHRAPAALAHDCARLGIGRLVHVSALGLHAQARSAFVRSKLRGEGALAASGDLCIIVRPSLLQGEGGFGARWIQRVARWPVHFIPVDATGRIAVVDVRDVADAIAVLCEQRAGSAARTVELGGGTNVTMRDYLATLRSCASLRHARVVAVPASIARLASHVCDLLHFSPFSLGHLELLRRDNVPAINALPDILGRSPRPIASDIAKEASRGYVFPGAPMFRSRES